MDNVINQVEELKKMILSSDEYKEYKECERKLQKNNQILQIIEKIKKLQKIIINKQNKNIDSNKEEIELQSLFKKLNNYNEYENYIKSSQTLNKILTDIQCKFETYFNKFTI